MAYCLQSELIEYSGNYGCFDTSSIYFDDSKDLGGNENDFLKYSIKKIKIFSGKKNDNIIIGGIQLTYKNHLTQELKELNMRKGKIDYEDEDVETFEIKSNEYLINFYIRFPNDGSFITQIGFETNKGRKILKGCEKGENKIISINGGENLILGTFGHYSSNLDSCGVLYTNLKKYLNKFHRAYFELRFKIKKDEKFKKEKFDNFNSFSESDKYLLKACIMPDSVFNEIMKFCLLK